MPTQGEGYMQRNSHMINDKKINELNLPVSYHSLALNYNYDIRLDNSYYNYYPFYKYYLKNLPYSKNVLNKNFVLQEKTIVEQYNQGFRLFHLHISIDEDFKYWVSNIFAICTLEHALTMFYDFDEKIYLYITCDEKISGDNQRYNGLKENFNTEYEDYDSNKTIDQYNNIIIIYHDNDDNDANKLDVVKEISFNPLVGKNIMLILFISILIIMLLMVIVKGILNRKNENEIYITGSVSFFLIILGMVLSFLVGTKKSVSIYSDSDIYLTDENRISFIYDKNNCPDAHFWNGNDCEEIGDGYYLHDKNNGNYEGSYSLCEPGYKCD